MARRRATLKRSTGQARGGGGGVITSGHIWAFIIVGFLFGTIMLSMAGEGMAGVGSDPGNQWRIESVYKGAVQVTSIRTGELYQIDDPGLVRKCLTGKLKKGDVITW